MIEDLLVELGVLHLLILEHDRDFYFVVFVEEFGDLAGLGVEVFGVDFWVVFYLFDGDS